MSYVKKKGGEEFIASYSKTKLLTHDKKCHADDTKKNASLVEKTVQHTNSKQNADSGKINARNS